MPSVIDTSRSGPSTLAAVVAWNIPVPRLLPDANLVKQNAPGRLLKSGNGHARFGAQEDVRRALVAQCRLEEGEYRAYYPHVIPIRSMRYR